MLWAPQAGLSQPPKLLKTLILIVILITVVFFWHRMNHQTAVEKSTMRYAENSRKSFVDPSIFANLKRLRLREKDIGQVDDERVLQSTPVFVTGFSSNHFQESFDLFDTFQKCFPSRNATVFNLDVPGSFGNITTKFPFLQIVDFPFNKYPSHVKKLKEYRFKPLIVAEILAVYDSVWWMDTSTHWSTDSGKKVEELFQLIRSRQLFELQFLTGTGHSIYATTYPGLYDYFPAEIKLFKKTHMYGANLFVMFATKRIRGGVLRWWVACALEQTCMAPEGARLSPCESAGDSYNNFAKCHRYDQSTLNVLTNKLSRRVFGPNTTDSRYSFAGFDVFVHRHIEAY